MILHVLDGSFFVVIAALVWYDALRQKQHVYMLAIVAHNLHNRGDRL